MKPLALLIVGVVLGWAASGVDWTSDAVGQNAPRNAEPPGLPKVSPELQQRIDEWRKEAADYSQINRFQISAYGTQTSNGAYAVDTATGKVWHVSSGGAVVIASELPEK